MLVYSFDCPFALLEWPGDAAVAGGRDGSAVNSPCDSAVDVRMEFELLLAPRNGVIDDKYGAIAGSENGEL